MDGGFDFDIENEDIEVEDEQLQVLKVQNIGKSFFLFGIHILILSFRLR